MLLLCTCHPFSQSGEQLLVFIGQFSLPCMSRYVSRSSKSISIISLMLLHNSKALVIICKQNHNQIFYVVGMFKGQLKWKFFFLEICVLHHTMHKTTIFIIQLYFVDEL